MARVEAWIEEWLCLQRLSYLFAYRIKMKVRRLDNDINNDNMYGLYKLRACSAKKNKLGRKLQTMPLDRPLKSRPFFQRTSFVGLFLARKPTEDVKNLPRIELSQVNLIKKPFMAHEVDFPVHLFIHSFAFAFFAMSAARLISTLRQLTLLESCSCAILCW